MDEAEFIKLTKLCHISCSEDERKNFLDSLGRVLEYIAALKEVNTAGVLPCNTVLETLCNVMRDDSAGELLSREEFLSNAPAHTGGMIRVPPVIKQG